MEYRYSGKSSKKIAAFDLDYTLLVPKDPKRKFPKDRNDAKYLYPEIPKKIKNLRSRGYKIVIFSNQKKTKPEDIFYKVDRFFDVSKTDVFISLQDDDCRKPLPGMFDKFIKLNGPVNKMFYVGDAAGRQKDFSDSDLKFALNSKIEFYTPEDIFLNQKVDIPEVKSYPLEFEKLKPTKLTLPKQKAMLMILQVGMPGCGKSTLSSKLESRYNFTVISNDRTGSIAKSLKVCKSELSVGNGVIIDNTNGSKSARDKFSVLARHLGYKVGVIIHTIPPECCRYLNKLRVFKNKTKCIPEVAYRVYNKNFEYPSLNDYDFVKEYIPRVDVKELTLYV